MLERVRATATEGTELDYSHADSRTPLLDETADDSFEGIQLHESRDSGFTSTPKHKIRDPRVQTMPGRFHHWPLPVTGAVITEIPEHEAVQLFSTSEL
jgi:hypothetical protein